MTSKAAPVVETVVETSAPEPTLAAEAARQSMIDYMAEKYAKEERVEVKVRNDGDVFLSVNGYSFLIQPNKKVKVPKSILPLLEEAGYI